MCHFIRLRLQQWCQNVRLLSQNICYCGIRKTYDLIKREHTWSLCWSHFYDYTAQGYIDQQDKAGARLDQQDKARLVGQGWGKARLVGQGQISGTRLGRGQISRTMLNQQDKARLAGRRQISGTRDEISRTTLDQRDDKPNLDLISMSQLKRFLRFSVNVQPSEAPCNSIKVEAQNGTPRVCV